MTPTPASGSSGSWPFCRRTQRGSRPLPPPERPDTGSGSSLAYPPYGRRGAACFEHDDVSLEQDDGDGAARRFENAADGAEDLAVRGRQGLIVERVLDEQLQAGNRHGLVERDQRAPVRQVQQLDAGAP